MLEKYKEAMLLMPNPGLKHLADEAKEFVEEPSKEEFYDVLHTLCRMLKVPPALTYCVAKPTAMKHAIRYSQRGCPRSERNCRAAGDSCCCKAS